MKSIQIPAAELKYALAGIKHVVNKGRYLPVLSCIRVHCSQGKVYLKATNLDDFVSFRMEDAQIQTPADILVPYEQLQK